MSRRIEYMTLSGHLIDSRSINMTPEEFRPYARERLQREAERITQPHDPNRPKIVEAVRLMEDDHELCRVELGDVMGVQRAAGDTTVLTKKQGPPLQPLKLSPSGGLGTEVFTVRTCAGS